MSLKKIEFDIRNNVMIETDRYRVEPIGLITFLAVLRGTLEDKQILAAWGEVIKWANEGDLKTNPEHAESFASFERLMVYVEAQQAHAHAN